MRSSFDLRRLFQTVDAERDRRDLSWAALAREVGVSASTIRRFADADDADADDAHADADADADEADGVLTVVGWLGVAPEDFVSDDSVSGERLRTVGGSVVRVDMESVAQASGDARGARGRTRTTIQRLVGVSQRSGQTVASLTRGRERESGS